MITDDEEGGTPTATATAGFGGDGQRWSGKKLATAGLHHISPPVSGGSQDRSTEHVKPVARGFVA